MIRKYNYKNYDIKIYLLKQSSFYCGNLYYKISYDIEDKTTLEKYEYNENTCYMDYKANELLEVAKDNIKKIIDKHDKNKCLYTTL